MDKDWHDKEIERLEGWIRRSREQIEWAVQYAAGCLEQLRAEEQWLADSIHNKEDFERSNKNDTESSN